MITRNSPRQRPPKTAKPVSRGSISRESGPLRFIFIGLGLLCLAFGIIGIVLPLVPTTFPLLLAAGLFARSSPKFHHWLLHHRILGIFIRNYREGLGMTCRHKRVTLITLWVGIGISACLTRGSVAALVILALVLVGVTMHVAMLPTASAGSDG